MTTPPDKRIKALRRFALSITALNIVGHLVLGFEQAYLTPIVAIITAYTFELGFEAIEARLQKRAPRFVGTPPFRHLVDFLLPAHITALACAMLLYGNDRLMPTIFAVIVAVTSKYVFRVKIGKGWRHVLNPSNFGIATTLVLFEWVSIAPPYHFTEWTGGVVDWAIPLAILTLGTMLNAKLTGKWPLILGWVGGFVLQALIRTTVFDTSLIGALLPMTGVAFILYTNYMITDPGTTPSKPARQVAFGMATAGVYGLLVSFHIVFGLFFALVIVCAIRGTALALLAVTASARERGPIPRAEPVAVPEGAR
ncbi:enediyne biosynthesis protein UnbU [Sphaerisporangium sp. NBC_01403]|uniref:enediyne biosynthesis protein UnbU n=1 Tax=Sphaerisporangium sp. NBC_01403 TaxID=2903599 RepID=UPI00324D8E6E